MYLSLPRASWPDDHSNDREASKLDWSINSLMTANEGQNIQCMMWIDHCRSHTSKLDCMDTATSSGHWLLSWLNARLSTRHPFFVWADPINDAVYNAPRFWKLDLLCCFHVDQLNGLRCLSSSLTPRSYCMVFSRFVHHKVFRALPSQSLFVVAASEPCVKVAGIQFADPADPIACYKSFPLNETLRQNVLAVVSRVFDFYITSI